MRNLGIENETKIKGILVSKLVNKVLTDVNKSLTQAGRFIIIVFWI